jgi:exosome complex RNA-binding protein Rrp42 (RNase PH superfamily)
MQYNSHSTYAMAISSSEAQYIIESCLADFRIDGRQSTEYRPYTITNRSTKCNTDNVSADNAAAAPSLILSNGSSRIHLPGSTTDVLCSVKADLVHPSPSKPNEGVVELNVDLSLCGGGGAINTSGGGGGQKRRRQQREEESQITSLLQRLVLPHAVNYEKLVVWRGRYVWRLAVDLVVLRCDGCVLDASSIAVREALGNTRLPKVQAVMEGEDSNNNDRGGSSSKNDLLVDGDFNKAVPPAGAEDCPLVVTVAVLSGSSSSSSAGASSKADSKKRRHRSIAIIDARTEEEVCASLRVCVSVDPNGMVCGVHTLGGGGGVVASSAEEGGGSMPLAMMLGDIVNSAAMAAKNLYEILLHNEGENVTNNMNMRKKTVANDDRSGYGYLLRNHFLIQ